MSLEWSAPESDGGSRITGYVVIIVFPISSRTVYFRKFVRGTSTSCKLFPGRTYQFAVAAKNKVGHGEFSNFSFVFPVESGKGFQNVLAICLYLGSLWCYMYILIFLVTDTSFSLSYSELCLVGLAFDVVY